MIVLITAVLVIHVLSVMVAVGSATLVDYLHLVGLKKKSLERGLVKLYPSVSKVMNTALIIIYASGLVLVSQNPLLLQSSLFKTKLALVFLVTINGVYLQKQVSPHLDNCVLKGTKYCTAQVLNSSAIAGSVSIVTWYAIVILSLSKVVGYDALHFLLVYVLVLLGAITVSYLIERHARKWRM